MKHHCSTPLAACGCAMASQNPLRARFNSFDAHSIVDQLRIERGEFADYKRLSRFHYKAGRPGAVTSVVRMVHAAPTVVGRYLHRPPVANETQVVGVLVISLPHLACQLRDIATCNRYRGLQPRDAAAMLNREVRTISRVIIDPQWRGLGLAVKLVRHALQHARDDQQVFTEALAAMGRVSPFFEQAGMIRYDRPFRSRREHARLLDALQRLELEPASLASLRLVHITLQQLGSSASTWLLAELRRWRRAAHRTPAHELNAMTLNDLLVAARDELLAQPVYYLHRRSCSDFGERVRE